MSDACFRVTIKDIAAWSIVIAATGRNAAEAAAWRLFEEAESREAFERDDDTTVQVEQLNDAVQP